MIIAVDTGGTKTLIEAFYPDGAKTYIEKFPTPKDTNEYIEKVSEAITSNTEHGTVEAIAVAVPGPIRNNILTRSKNLGWEKFDVVAEFRSRFPSSKIFIANDADLAGLAETRALGGETHPGVSLYVTLSTGIGTGLCFNGKLFAGLARFEGGAMRFMYDGEPQRWEDFASGRNFRDRIGKMGSEVDDPAIWRDYAERAAIGLKALIPLLEPDQIIIGGSMGTHFQKYIDFLRESLDRTIPRHMKQTAISQAKHPEEAVIYGCYYYALDELAR